MTSIEKRDHPDFFHKSHQRYRALFDLVKEGILIMDFETGSIQDANPAILTMFGNVLEEIIGKKTWELGSIIDSKTAHSIFDELHSKDYLHILDFLMHNNKGDILPVDLIAQVYQMGDQKIIQITLNDISAQRLWAEVLDNSQIRYRRLFEVTQEGILILDYKSGQIVDANPFITNLMGFSLDELVGKELWEIGFVVDKELAQKAFQELQIKSYIRYSDLPLQHKFGQIMEVEFLSFVYSVGMEKVIQCNIRDMTNQKKLREYENAIMRSIQETIHSLACMSEIRDPYTTGHQQRVAELAVPIAKELKLPPNEIEGLRLSAILHDIGKFSIPLEIMIKSTKLEEIEKVMLRNHSLHGYNVLKGIQFPWPIAETVLQHHERLNGSGYPNRLRGYSILIGAKIIGVADTVEAMTGSRPYRPAIGIDTALQYIQTESGRLFEPVIVEACVKLFKEKQFQFSERPDKETYVSFAAKSSYGETL